MTLDRFRARSDAFLFAAERTDRDSLVFIEQGTADALRPRAREELMCPEPGCSAPAITTVNRAEGGRRDGYKHHRLPAEGSHAPESAMHRQAKALICRWARTLDAVASAEMEVPVAGGERVADVLLTSHAGNRLAVEIQYASESVGGLIKRTESYRAAGIAVSWVLGSVGGLSPRNNKLRAVHEKILDTGAPLLWINPVEEAIGWLAHTTLPKPVTSDDFSNSEIRFCGLDDLDLRATGLFPPGYLDLREAWRNATAEAEAARAEEERANAQQIREIRGRRLARARTKQSTPPVNTGTGQSRKLCQRCSLPLDRVCETAGVHFGDDCSNPHW